MFEKLNSSHSDFIFISYLILEPILWSRNKRQILTQLKSDNILINDVTFSQFSSTCQIYTKVHNFVKFLINGPRASNQCWFEYFFGRGMGHISIIVTFQVVFKTPQRNITWNLKNSTNNFLRYRDIFILTFLVGEVCTLLKRLISSSKVMYIL